MPNDDQKDSYKERIPKNTLIKIPILKDFQAKEREVDFSTIKATILSLAKVCIIYPLWHSRVVRNSNLTFGGYLAGATLVLFARSSLFMLCWCFEYVRTV